MDADVITLDTDWAPDCAIDYTAELLLHAGVKATWFITHDSPAVRRLAERRHIFELGIHPNFLAGSTHGSTPEEVMDTVLKVVPGATAARCHSCLHSFRHLELMAARGITSDHSVYLPRAKNIQPVTYVVKQVQRSMARVPFFWEDDYETLMARDRLWLPTPTSHPGLRVYDFHPIHVYCNTKHIEEYEALKKEGLLQDLTPSVLKKYRRSDNGAEEALTRLLKQLGQTWLVSEIVERAVP